MKQIRDIMESGDTFDYKAAAAFLKDKAESEKERDRKLFLQAEKDAELIIEMIKEYQPERIYQWGSLLQMDQFDINSDIDIAVEGMDSAEKFFELYGRAVAITDFSLDLVELEKINDVHRKSIRETGRLVYEK